MRKTFPIALTIAGSDSGGGAGIQADLKTFAALSVHGTSAITCVTAQNPKGVLAVQACQPAIVRHQLEAVFAELPPNAVKTGMLYSTAILRVVVAFFSTGRCPPLVVDPVMVATSGATLLQPSAIAMLRDQLLPLASLVTPNLDEVELLLGRRPRSVEEMRLAARKIVHHFGCAALIKGGHLAGGCEAVDIFNDGDVELLLTAPRLRGRHLHGAGCTFAAAITGFLARGRKLTGAVASAKSFLTNTITHSIRAGRHDVLDNLRGLPGRSG